jgi:hypothetical protein
MFASKQSSRASLDGRRADTVAMLRLRFRDLGGLGAGWTFAEK